MIWFYFSVYILVGIGSTIIPLVTGNYSIHDVFSFVFTY